MAATPPPVPQAMALASQRLQAGDLSGAQAALAPFFQAQLPSDPKLLNLAGIIYLAAARFAEAAQLCGAAASAAPGKAVFAHNQARALAGLGRLDETEAALRAAVTADPDFAQAWFDLGALLHRLGKFEEAQPAFHAVLRIVPTHGPARLMLGTALVETGRSHEAERPLREGLEDAADPRLKMLLHFNLGLALRRQRKDVAALQQYDAAHALDASLPGLAVHRGQTLQNLNRHGDALAVLRDALAHNPADPELHHRTNDLLYRLGDADFLRSYDRAPDSRALRLDKAYFLSHAGRGAECHEVYAGLLERNPGDTEAAFGAARALTMVGRHADAAAAFDALLARTETDAALLIAAAEPALLGGDPQRALHHVERALAREPFHQGALAMKSVALRLLEDERDEALNGYDTLVREFLLEPPPGFSSMEDFNEALNDVLDGQHPPTREFINQSLRGGTQTPDLLFDTAEPLLVALRQSIDAVVARYIAEMATDARHPFLSRRARDFRYCGSWSSRLRDCGFHANHIHEQGWISSCYYVAVPDIVRDREARQGWIKFGESSFDVPLKNPIRRAIQPAPGKLVLFPSYMWHGTIAFRDAAPRTTVAFDVVPT